MELSTRVETFGQDDQSWLGSAHGTDHGRSVTLDHSLFTPATHYPQGTYKGGTPLAKVTATGLYGPYDNAATDGRETLVGFLLTSVRAGRASDSRVIAALLEHGRVVRARLPIAIDDAGAADVAGRITFA